MDRLGSSSKTTDEKNVQGGRAQETHHTRGDATTEQTPPESKSIIKKIPHFIGNAVYYAGKAVIWTSAAAAVGNLLTAPTLAEGRYNNDRYPPAPHYDRYHPESHYDRYYPEPHYDRYYPEPHYDRYRPEPYYDRYRPTPSYAPSM